MTWLLKKRAIPNAERKAYVMTAPLSRSPLPRSLRTMTLSPHPAVGATEVGTDVIRPSEILEDSARGVIEKLAEGNFQSILRITSKQGTVRANHYHKRDSHLCYLLKGKLEYVWREALDEQAPLQRMVINPGQLFYTPPMVAHAMVFLEDSEFYAFSTEPRHGRSAYEDEVVRVKLVEPPAA